MNQIITVKAKITEDVELVLAFAKIKTAVNVRDQLKLAGYEAQAIIVKETE